MTPGARYPVHHFAPADCTIKVGNDHHTGDLELPDEGEYDDIVTVFVPYKQD